MVMNMIPETHRVWLSRGLSNVTDVARTTDRAGRFEILVSHTEPDFPGFSFADRHWIEPEGLYGREDMFADYALLRCQEMDVRLLWPGKGAPQVMARRSAFEAAGIRTLLAGDADTCKLLDDKAAFYRDLEGTGLPVPEWMEFSTLAGFDDAWSAMRPCVPSLCIKPTVSIFALGFRRIVEDDDDWGRFVSNDQYRIGLNEFRRILCGVHKPRAFMLMRTLEGEERSVDCIAHNGRLVAAVSRVKRGRTQHIETDHPAIAITRALVERYALNGVINVQTKDHEGRTYILEVNPRMSGGMIYSCQTGLHLPYWAMMLALGNASPEDVPQPSNGVVAPIQGVVRMG
jgi:hypothetical protein